MNYECESSICFLIGRVLWEFVVCNEFLGLVCGVVRDDS